MFIVGKWKFSYTGVREREIERKKMTKWIKVLYNRFLNVIFTFSQINRFPRDCVCVCRHSSFTATKPFIGSREDRHWTNLNVAFTTSAVFPRHVSSCGLFVCSYKYKHSNIGVHRYPCGCILHRHICVSHSSIYIFHTPSVWSEGGEAEGRGVWVSGSLRSLSALPAERKQGFRGRDLFLVRRRRRMSQRLCLNEEDAANARRHCRGVDVSSELN